jgi:hypothetical protein
MADHDPLGARVADAVERIRELLNDLVGVDPPSPAARMLAGSGSCASTAAPEAM